MPPSPGHRVFISDIHSHIGNLESFFSYMQGFVLDSVYCAGDMIHNGRDYDANRVIDLLLQHRVKAIRGNHDLIDNKPAHKLRDDVKEYLTQTPEEEVIDGILMFHSSCREPGTRLANDELRLQEAKHIHTTFPDVPLVVYGHSHEAHIFCLDKKTGKQVQIPSRGPVILEPTNLYLVNPGSLGERHFDGHSLAILDTTTSTLRIHTLDELLRLHKTRNLLLTFEEDWMSHLKGDSWSWVSFGVEAGKIANAYPEFPSVTTLLKELDYKGTNIEKRGYYWSYSLRLAQTLDKITDPLVYTYYDVRSPLRVRESIFSTK